MTSENISKSKLKELALQAADLISEHKFVRIISHNDADGITSASILCHALIKKNIPFHTSIAGRLSQNVIDIIKSSVDINDLVIFCDMGSSQKDLIAQISNKVIIIDHHMPVGDIPATIVVNPHNVGIDGSIYLSASGATYLVAKEMDITNIDLSGLAVAGTVGDKQIFENLNLDILEEAQHAGIITIKKGLKVGDGDVAEILEYTPEPYLDITGDKQKIHDFLDILGIKGNINDLNATDLKKLTSAIALKLTKNASSEAVSAAIGDIYYLEKEVVKNVYDFVSLLNICGKLEKTDVALALCMRDSTDIDELRNNTLEYQQSIINNVKNAESMLKEGKNIWYLLGDDISDTGMISSIVVRYIHPEKPFIATNHVEDTVKISARGTRALVDKGLDLAYALREASTAVGGQGGGHDIASGAAVPPEKRMEFIEIVDNIIGEQLKN